MATTKVRRLKAKEVTKERLKKHLKHKKRYSVSARKQVKKEVGLERKGKLTMNKHGGKKITSVKQAVAKALNIADSKRKKHRKEAERKRD